MQERSKGKEAYNKFVEEYALPYFYQPWFLDEVCKSGSWDVSLVLKDNKVVAAWPYFQKKKYGITYLTTPPLTAYLGPWYQLPTNITKEASAQSYHKKILRALSKGLPSSQLIDTRWLPDIHNWMALSWEGYKQTTRYTYRIDLTQNEEELFSAITDSQRNTLRKSIAHYDVAIHNDPEEFWRLNTATFHRQHMEVPYEEEYFKSLYATLINHDAVDIWMSKDKEGYKGAACVAYDKTTAYLIATGRKSDESGAVSAAIWSAVLAAKRRGCTTFDFEGSMIEGVASYFKSFGGKLTPYNRIIKTKSKFWEIVFRMLNRF